MFANEKIKRVSNLRYRLLNEVRIKVRQSQITSFVKQPTKSQSKQVRLEQKISF